MVGFIRKRKDPQTDSDYSAVTSREAALKLVRRGQLHPLHLMPLEFGGADVDANTVYVPRSAVERKQAVDHDVILPLITSGDGVQYTATPHYAGASFVPNAITITASGPEDFTTTLDIWAPHATS